MPVYQAAWHGATRGRLRFFRALGLGVGREYLLSLIFIAKVKAPTQAWSLKSACSYCFFDCQGMAFPCGFVLQTAANRIAAGTASAATTIATLITAASATGRASLRILLINFSFNA